tara:strand:+ start:322 stop:588 length:267 start_codon:yes stop_codon:yes gene_type:complete
MSGIKNRSGRPSKADEIKMIERLSPLDDLAFQKLKEGIERDEFAYLKLWMYFRFGRPKQIQDVTIQTEQPIFDLSLMPDIMFKKTTEI